MKSSLTFTHVLAYLFGLAGVALPAIQKWAPVLMPGPKGIAIAAAAGIVLAAGHQIVVGLRAGGVTLPSPSKIASLMVAGLLLGMLLASVVVVTGCAQLEGFITSPATQPYQQVAADAVVQLAISKGVPAAEIVKVAQEALALDTGATTAITDVEGYVNGKINGSSIPAVDKEALVLVTDSLGMIAATEAAKVVGSTPTVAIADVLNKIIVAANAQLAVPNPVINTTAAGTVS